MSKQTPQLKVLTYSPPKSDSTVNCPKTLMIKKGMSLQNATAYYSQACGGLAAKMLMSELSKAQIDQEDGTEVQRMIVLSLLR